MKYLICIFSLFFSMIGYSKEVKIVFVGDSLTAGYGVERKDSFPSLISKKLESGSKQKVKVINGGVSGSTTANAMSRMKWFFKAKPNIIVLALGANDGLRGIDYKDSMKNLDTAISMGKERGVHMILAGMQLPPNYGEAYRKNFSSMYPSLAKKHSIPLIPFLLKNVAAIKELNIEDGIHPNENGHKKIAELVYPFILSSLKKLEKAKK